MWKEAALATAVFAAVPQFFHAPVRVAAIVPSAGKTFAPACRDGQVLDSRPDPAWVRQSFNRDHCLEPAMPVVFDGVKASRAQVVAAIASAQVYGAAAAAFQKCIADFVAARRNVRPLASSDLIIENHRILLSRRSAGARRRRRGRKSWLSTPTAAAATIHKDTKGTDS